MELDIVVPQAPHRVPQGSIQDLLDLFDREGFELKNLAAAYQGTYDREKRICGGRSDQCHNPVFHIR